MDLGFPDNPRYHDVAISQVHDLWGPEFLNVQLFPSMQTHQEFP